MVDPERAERRLSGPVGLDERLAALADALAAAAAAAAGAVLLGWPTVLPAGSSRALWRPPHRRSPRSSGSWVALSEGGGELGSLHAAASGLRGVAERAGSGSVLAIPVEAGGERLGVVELLRSAGAFSQAERTLARLAASQMAVLAAWRAGTDPDERRGDDALETAGDALAGGAEGAHVGHTIARLATRAAGARAGALWELGDNGAAPVPVATAGSGRDVVEWHAPERPQSGDRRLVVVEWDGEQSVVTLRLDESPAALLQLVFDAEPQPEKVKALEVFAGRAPGPARRPQGRPHAQRARALPRAARRLGQAIAELSLAHTLETAVDASTSCSLPTESPSICARGRPSGRAAARAWARGTTRRRRRCSSSRWGRSAAAARSWSRTPRPTRGSRLSATPSARAGHRALVAAPLVVLRRGDRPAGRGAPARARARARRRSALLVALAAQLAVAVQNARLHERRDSG